MLALVLTHKHHGETHIGTTPGGTGEIINTCDEVQELCEKSWHKGRIARRGSESWPQTRQEHTEYNKQWERQEDKPPRRLRPTTQEGGQHIQQMRATMGGPWRRAPSPCFSSHTAQILRSPQHKGGQRKHATNPKCWATTQKRCPTILETSGQQSERHRAVHRPRARGLLCRGADRRSTKRSARVLRNSTSHI